MLGVRIINFDKFYGPYIFTDAETENIQSVFPIFIRRQLRAHNLNAMKNVTKNELSKSGLCLNIILIL